MQQQDLYTDTGYLLVRAVTAGGALPVDSANVTVFGADATNIRISKRAKTDANGLTEKIPLPTPRASLSQSPGAPTPYASYNVTVTKEGFYVHQSLRVPVFGGITSVQVAEMIPRSYSGDPGTAPIDIPKTAETEPFSQGGASDAT